MKSSIKCTFTRSPWARSAGIAQLVLAITMIACFWCVVLPWYGSQPAMEKHLQFLDDRGIDASAMFYTELDAMDAILEKLEEGP